MSGRCSWSSRGRRCRRWTSSTWPRLQDASDGADLSACRTACIYLIFCDTRTIGSRSRSKPSAEPRRSRSRCRRVPHRPTHIHNQITNRMNSERRQVKPSQPRAPISLKEELVSHLNSEHHLTGPEPTHMLPVERRERRETVENTVCKW